jgi:hypothetical protein
MVVHTYNLRRLRKKDHKFTASLGSLAITCFKIKKKKKEEDRGLRMYLSACQACMKSWVRLPALNFKNFKKIGHR